MISVLKIRMGFMPVMFPPLNGSGAAYPLLTHQNRTLIRIQHIRSMALVCFSFSMEKKSLFRNMQSNRLSLQNDFDIEKTYQFVRDNFDSSEGLSSDKVIDNIILKKFSD